MRPGCRGRPCLRRTKRKPATPLPGVPDVQEAEAGGFEAQEFRPPWVAQPDCPRREGGGCSSCVHMSQDTGAEVQGTPGRPLQSCPAQHLVSRIQEEVFRLPLWVACWTTCYCPHSDASFEHRRGCLLAELGPECTQWPCPAAPAPCCCGCSTALFPFQSLAALVTGSGVPGAPYPRHSWVPQGSGGAALGLWLTMVTGGERMAGALSAHWAGSSWPLLSTRGSPCCPQGVT